MPQTDLPDHDLARAFPRIEDTSTSVVARSTFLLRLFWQLRNNRNVMIVS
jgi:hypothetical protein